MLYGVFHGDLHGGNLFVRSRRPGRASRLRHNRPPRRTGAARLLAARGRSDGQRRARPDRGAPRPRRVPPDVDVSQLIVDLGLDRPPLDPMQLSVEQLTAEMRELTKRLLGYGARMPKELMLFVKDLLFFDGAMALMAPDVDLLAEIMKVVMYFHVHHGERIARDIGVPFEAQPVVDLEAIRASFGFAETQDRHPPRAATQARGDKGPFRAGTERSRGPRPTGQAKCRYGSDQPTGPPARPRQCG